MTICGENAIWLQSILCYHHIVPFVLKWLATVLWSAVETVVWSWCCNGSFTAKRWWQRWRGSIKQPFSTTSSLVEHISLFYFLWIPELHFYSWFLIRRNSNIMFNGIPTSCPTWYVCNEVFNLGALLSAPPPASTPIRTSSATPPSAKAVGSRPLPALPKVSAPGFRYQGQGCNGILCHDICLY